MPGWIEVGIRSIAVIIGLFFIMKLLGKKQMGRLSFFEYILGITAGSIAADLSMDLELDLVAGITSILIWLLFPLAISLISLKSKRFSDFAQGKSTVFIQNGKILEGNLKSEKYSTNELLEQLRKKGVFQVSDVEFASLEPCGDLSVLLKREKQPLTFGDTIMNSSTITEPHTVIMDQIILDDMLKKAGLDRKWLEEQLNRMGLSHKDVYLAQIDSNQRLFVDLYNDQANIAPPVTKELLVESIKKCKLTLESLVSQEVTESTTEMYSKLLNDLIAIEENLNKINKGHI